MAEAGRDLRAQQASEREDQMRDRFGLEPGGQGRPGVDALLKLGDSREVPFEVKSSDTNSVSTARDVGREHLEKWRRRHWLFGFYVRGSRNPPVATRYIYASPRQLEPWIAEQEQKVLPDWELVRRLPGLADREVLAAVAGDKDEYTLQDAKDLLKQQKLEAGEHMTPEMRAVLNAAGLDEPRKMTTPVYRALMDRHAGFSDAALGGLIATLSDPLGAAAIAAAIGTQAPYGLTGVTELLRGRRLSAGGRLTKRAIAQTADCRDGYSPERMLVLLHERARYLLDRGATRNNPHIPEKRLVELVPEDQVIPGETGRRAQWLEEMVQRELQAIAAASEAATA